MMVHTCEPSTQGLRRQQQADFCRPGRDRQTDRDTETERQTDKEEGERRRKGEREEKTQRGDGEMETE